MRIFGFVLRVLLLIAIFAATGVWASHVILLRATSQGQAEYNVRLASYMAGLFAGGSAATLVGICLLLVDKRNDRRSGR